MAVHSTEEALSSPNQQMMGANFLPHPIPKYKFPGPETNSTAAYQLVHGELLLDGNSRQNLATFSRPGSSQKFAS
jgi:glutamate decarboxylase